MGTEVSGEIVKNIFKLGFILMAYAGIAGLLLGWMYTKTKPRIEQQAKMEQEQAIKEVLPSDALVFDEIILSDSTIVFIGFSDEEKTVPVGFAVIGVKYGFSSNVKTMVGLKTDFTVSGIKVMYQSETPGLGTNVQKEWFQEQFVTKNLDQLNVDKDGGDIKSITGATISSRTVTESVVEVIENLMEHKSELPAAQKQKTLKDSVTVRELISDAN